MRRGKRCPDRRGRRHRRRYRVTAVYRSAAAIARLAVSLMDPGLYMTGQTVLYDGGLTLRRDLMK